MAAILVTWIANSVAIYCVAYLMRSVEVASFRDALFAGAVLSLINAIIKPVLVILTLPLTIITLGIFYFFVTAFCLWLVSEFYSGFMIHGFFTTLVAALLVSIFSSFIHGLLSKATTPNR
jgi:putative membrane protein